MSTLRITSNLRRELILAAARRCFARHGFAGTTTKSVAAAASISEGLLYKHFPTKAALYAEILSEACEADPDLIRLLKLEPSTATLVTLVREMVVHFLRTARVPEQEEAQRLCLMTSSYLDDGEFARLLYEKIADLVAPLFTASLERAIEAGDAVRMQGAPLNLFWFAHQVAHMVALSLIPASPVLDYGGEAQLERQLCEFVLRGIGMRDAVLTEHLDCKTPSQLAPLGAKESA